MSLFPVLARWGCCALSLLPLLAHAETEDWEDRSARYQATYIWQRHSPFAEQRPAVPANGGSWNDYAETRYGLNNGRDKSYTASLTAYWGFRPWAGGELYINPEVTQGVPLSGALVGMGGFYNGEITRAAGTNPTIYRQRLFLRQTWDLGGAREKVEADLNQMAGSQDKNRFVLTLGNFSVLDIFDKNAYTGDPRRQFMNWGNMSSVAFDYAADARGWSWGFAGEWYQDDWVLRFGRMTGPQSPNGLPMDMRIGRHYGDQVEVEHQHDWNGQPGSVRLLAWRNRARLASFRDAIAYGDSVGWTPQSNGMEYILDVRGGEKFKYGLGINADQALSPNLGLFFRSMWADGRTETYAFAEVDRSLAFGMELQGAAWGRGQDQAGVALLNHFLSRDRREYLARGGVSFFIGDGWLNYRPEQVFESYYSFGLARQLWLTADLQHVRHPAYNGDRGPVNILGLRLHAEF